MGALYGTLIRMAGPLTSDVLYETCLRALLDADGEWDETNCDRQQLLTDLIRVLNWYLHDAWQRGETKEPQMLGFEAAERVYMRTYTSVYRGDEVATGWPEALPCTDVVRYPRELIARIALAMADRDNAETLAMAAYYRKQQEQSR